MWSLKGAPSSWGGRLLALIGFEILNLESLFFGEITAKALWPDEMAHRATGGARATVCPPLTYRDSGPGPSAVVTN